VEFEQLAVVDDLAEHLPHVVGPVRFRGHDLGEPGPPIALRAARPGGGHRVEIVARQQGKQVADVVETALLVVVHHGRHAGTRAVHLGAAELVVPDPVPAHRLDHVRAGQVHLRDVADHEGESASVGEYTAPPAHGPSTTLICGITPDASTWRRKMPP
jgi:hypothetical protein